MTLGEKLTKERKTLNYTQEQFADIDIISKIHRFVEAGKERKLG